MGVYLNPGNKNYQELLNSSIVVDKSLLIEKVSKLINTSEKYICVSRPRRFGKSTDANMLAAYYSCGCDSHELFNDLKISAWNEYKVHLNQHNVIQLNMQSFLSRSKDVVQMLQLISEKVIRELKREYPNYCEESDLISVLENLYAYENQGVIFVVDEWDCIFREYKEDKESQKKYLDFLRLLFKDQPYVELVYMTGILPIKKYGTHSALNMFDEISMLDAKGYSAFMGFTEAEVADLCEKYSVDFRRMKDWYDGYCMRGGISTYSPRSVTAAIRNDDFSDYWSQTETYEALRAYIDLNYNGLKDAVVWGLAGEKIKINVRTFQNSMDSFSTKDDVLTLLVHLGYLGYCYETGEVYIPNNEVKDIFIDSIETSNWSYVAEVFKNSQDLLKATWNQQSDRVASYIDNSHYETSILECVETTPAVIKDRRN